MKFIFPLIANLVIAGVSECITEAKWLEQMFKAPLFDTSAPTEVTIVQGGDAQLHCKVKRLNNKTVSWIRSRDLQILSVGTHVHINDARFLIARDSAQNDWTLVIHRASANDSGTYECQVSVQPPISYQITLQVIVPKTSIENSEEVYIDAGSLLNLTCTISAAPTASHYVFWYHNGKTIDYHSGRGGVSVVTSKANVTTSQLLITDATAADSGKYRCSPSHAPVAQTTVHVLTGEKPAAMHTSHGCYNTCRNEHILLFFSLLSLILKNENLFH